MPYATVQDLIDRYGRDELTQLTDRDGDGAIDSATVERAIADAAAEIDGHLGGRYPAPLDPAPPVLTRVACDIARYLLWGERAGESLRQRYEDARRLLERIGSGQVNLGVAPPAASNTVQFNGGDHVWGRNKGGLR
jgi:phage gp36-like protein